MDKVINAEGGKFFSVDSKGFFHTILVILGFLLLIVSVIAVLLLSAVFFWWPLQLTVFGVDMTPVISWLIDYKWFVGGLEILTLVCFWFFYIKVPERRYANKVLADKGK